MVNAKTCQFIQSCIKITRQFTIGYTSLLMITHRTLIDKRGVTRSKKNWSDGWQWRATQPPLKGTVHKLTCQSQQIWFKLVCHSKTKHPFTSYKRTPETIFSFTFYFKEMLGSDLILDTWKGTCRQNHTKSFIRFIKKEFICIFVYTDVACSSIQCIHHCEHLMSHAALKYTSLCPLVQTVLCVCVYVWYLYIVYNKRWYRNKRPTLNTCHMHFHNTLQIFKSISHVISERQQKYLLLVIIHPPKIKS